ncbi:MAG: glycosyltransferase family 1 protein [Patescibacteria group bacterium]
MKIGIIVEPYEEQNTSGISYSILSQTRGLLELDHENEYIIYTSKSFKKERLTENARNILIPKSFLGKNLWFLKNSFFNRSVISDVLIFNMPLLPLVLPRHIKTIPIFLESVYKAPYGLSLKRRVSMIIQESFVGTAIKKAKFIITPSNATRDDLLSHHSVDENKVKNIYIGFHNLDGYNNESRLDELQESYFLFVGRVKFKKNIHNMLEGFIIFKDKYKTGHKFYLAGLSDGNYRKVLEKRAMEAGIGEDLVFGGFVSDEDKYRLYKNTDALVFSTLKEGFGMPVIEAMSLGALVITSNRPPLNEISNGAAILVNPESPDDIAKAMSEAVMNKELRKELIKKGKENAKLFSWEKHTKELFNVIKSV